MRKLIYNIEGSGLNTNCLTNFQQKIVRLHPNGHWVDNHKLHPKTKPNLDPKWTLQNIEGGLYK